MTNKTTYYQEIGKSYLLWQKNFMKVTKKDMREQAKIKHRELSNEEKNKKREYGRNRY